MHYLLHFSYQKRNATTRQAGFSIVEMLLYMGLLSIFLVVLTSFFFSILDTQSRALVSTGLEENSKFISARMKYDLRRAETVTNGAALGDAAASVDLVIAGETYTYALSGTTLQLVTPTATVDVHGDEVTVNQFSVTRVGNVDGTDTFVINYQLQSVVQVGGDTEVKNYQFTVGRR